jgi:hypothetical protein
MVCSLPVHAERAGPASACSYSLRQNLEPEDATQQGRAGHGHAYLTLSGLQLQELHLLLLAHLVHLRHAHLHPLSIASSLLCHQRLAGLLLLCLHVLYPLLRHLLMLLHGWVVRDCGFAQVSMANNDRRKDAGHPRKLPTHRVEMGLLLEELLRLGGRIQVLHGVGVWAASAGRHACHDAGLAHLTAGTRDAHVADELMRHAGLRAWLAWVVCHAWRAHGMTGWCMLHSAARMRRESLRHASHHCSRPRRR